MTLIVGLLLACGQGCTPTPVETKIEKDTKPENAPKPPAIPPAPKKTPV